MAAAHVVTVKGHKHGKGVRNYCVYTVYDGKTTLPIIIDGDLKACARVMGLTEAGFYNALMRFRRGQSKRWEIYTRYLDGRKDMRKAAVHQ